MLVCITQNVSVHYPECLTSGEHEIHHLCSDPPWFLLLVITVSTFNLVCCFQKKTWQTLSENWVIIIDFQEINFTTALNDCKYRLNNIQLSQRQNEQTRFQWLVMKTPIQWNPYTNSRHSIADYPQLHKWLCIYKKGYL